jgi:hypothetical protein
MPKTLLSTAKWIKINSLRHGAWCVYFQTTTIMHYNKESLNIVLHAKPLFEPCKLWFHVLLFNVIGLQAAAELAC